MTWAGGRPLDVIYYRPRRYAALDTTAVERVAEGQGARIEFAASYGVEEREISGGLIRERHRVTVLQASPIQPPKLGYVPHAATVNYSFAEPPTFWVDFLATLNGGARANNGSNVWTANRPSYEITGSKVDDGGVWVGKVLMTAEVSAQRMRNWEVRAMGSVAAPKYEGVAPDAAGLALIDAFAADQAVGYLIPGAGLVTSASGLKWETGETSSDRVMTMSLTVEAQVDPRVEDGGGDGEQDEYGPLEQPLPSIA